jgi:hypothetical protein
MDQVKVERLGATEDGGQGWFVYTVEVDTEADFTINDQILDAEICRMSMIMLKYGDLYAELNAMLARKEEELKYLKARVSGAVRSEAEKNSKKTTEGKLTEEVAANELVQQAMFTMHQVRVDKLKTEHWWATAKKKADLLTALAYRQTAEIKRNY